MKRLLLFSGLVTLLVLTLPARLYAQMGFNSPADVKPTQDMEVYTRNGFLVQAKYQYVPADPNANINNLSCATNPPVINAFAGILKDPAGDASYAPATSYSCTQTISVFISESGFYATAIELVFEDLDTESDADYVIIRDALGREQRFSGNTPPSRITVSGSSATIQFITNNNLVVGRGFRLRWRALQSDGSTAPPPIAFGNALQFSTFSGAFHAGNANVVNGFSSIALGNNNTASGIATVALGYINRASGNVSSVLGYQNTASGDYSTALGFENRARGLASTVIGFRNVSKEYAGFVAGEYNDTLNVFLGNGRISTDRLFQIGNGIQSARSNAMTVLRNARTIINGVDSGTALANGSDAMLRINHNSGIGDGTVVLFEQDNDFARLDFKNNQTITNFWTIAGKPNGSPAFLNFYYQGVGDILQLKSDGSAWLRGTLTQNSDRRLKRDFQPLTAQQSLSQLTQLSGYNYYWREANRSQNLQTGLIAQEVQKLFPELVETDAKGYLSVNYIGLVPHLIESVKALKDQNEMLLKRLERLEAALPQRAPTGKSSRVATSVGRYTK